MKAVFLSDFLSDAFSIWLLPQQEWRGSNPLFPDLESGGLPSNLHSHSKERNIEAQQGHYLSERGRRTAL